MLKAIPSKNAEFIILLTSVLILFLLGEVRTMTAFSLFTVFVSFLWIGAQFPQETFFLLSCLARILTLLYYLTFDPYWWFDSFVDLDALYTLYDVPSIMTLTLQSTLTLYTYSLPIHLYGPFY